MPDVLIKDGTAVDGTGRAGFSADIDAIDHAALAIGRATLLNDLPAGGTRFVPSTRGSCVSLVAGEAVTKNDRLTRARPGRVVRGAQRRTT